MSLPMELIKYVIFIILGIVVMFKTYEFTKKIIGKKKGKDEFDLSYENI